ncbi:uncharacterized protein AtWU_05390 [Aspergillus tubingensis]|uniref:uncharacterized protein n=1 Tax=Aspergillus tubingensis TaxID=5068 RepID=UPI0015788A32|nr:uncharacterized protein AtWU_05390 [Aspergillus tubingensis]GFN15589.1 hypothetical protein AtWU_05390 [Aspergillus tubingensis]
MGSDDILIHFQPSHPIAPSLTSPNHIGRSGYRSLTPAARALLPCDILLDVSLSAGGDWSGKVSMHGVDRYSRAARPPDLLRR